MSGYNLITLDAGKILDNFTVEQLKNNNYCAKFEYDLSDKSSIRREIISSIDRYDDNALFYQIQQVVGETDAEEENSLQQVIIFVDFKKVFENQQDFKTSKDYRSLKKEDFNANPVYRLKWIFDKDNGGITLTFDGKIFKTFVPFDKSPSMSRACKISFIDKDFKAEINTRLLLGIDFSKISVVPSKYYAYRGLYLSSGYRIEQAENFKLNAETVIVIDDIEELWSGNVFTAKFNEDFWKCENCSEKLSINLFDGEGLISPDFAKFVSNFLKLKYNFAGDSHSFQVRMPFIKGVLHEVDFNKFFVDENLFGSETPLEIKDVFGLKRDLKKAKIILTKSMLKCCGWLKDYWNQEKLTSDPMEYFFQKVYEFQHALYVTGTDARLSNNGLVRLNYQFLSTLDLPAKDFEVLTQKHIESIDNVPKFFLREYLSAGQSADDDNVDEDQSAFQSEENARNKCIKILSQKEVFIHDPKVTSLIQEMQNTYKKNLCVGRFEVQGQQRYLSGDLLYFLIKIAMLIENFGISEDVAKKFYKDKCLYSDRFYMAMSPESKFQLKYDKFYTFLRNPHLSRNEQVILKPYAVKNSLYEKYFSNLVGAVMVSSKYAPIVPMVLGGADFDGDLVKIVSNKSIVDAVKNSVYEENQKRKLLPISIPSPKNKTQQESAEGSISFDTIVNTFSNKVGLISNIAAEIATKEYSTDTDEKFQGKCAECTIVTGLEIDAAKNGVHPQKNIQALVTLTIQSSRLKNFFALKDLYSKKKFFSPHIVSENPEETKLTLYASKRRFEKNLNPAIKNIPVYNIENQVSNIERLPGIYCRYVLQLKKAAKSKESSKKGSYIFFDFQRGKNWKSTLDKEKVKKLEKIVAAYLEVTKMANRIRKFQENSRQNKFTGYVFNILQIQYDGLNSELSDGVKVHEALNLTYANIFSILNDIERTNAALKNLVAEKWQFTRAKNRAQKISVILGIGIQSELIMPTMVELLSNFNNNGFMIFYYILKDIQSQYNEDVEFMEDFGETSETENIDIDVEKLEVLDEDIKNELLKKYYESSSRNEAKTIWNKYLVAICRKHLDVIFDSMEEAVKYLVSIISKDPQRNFFWNIFSTQEILNAMKVGEIIAE